jgi:hypothetical protein
MKFGGQICFALPVIAIVAPIIFAQTPAVREPHTLGVSSLKVPNLPAPKADSTLGGLVDPGR